MQGREGIPERTRPAADTTVVAELPADLIPILVEQSGKTDAEKLEAILADQRSRWRFGSPLATERYFELLPELANDPAARLALVEGEVRAREEAGLQSSLVDLVRRFPDLRGALTEIFEGSGSGHCDSSGQRAADDSRTVPYGQGIDGQPDAERTLPEFLDRYRILRVLGQGGFGMVYLARDELLDRSVAIKVPRLDRVGDGQEVDTFLCEARVLASLDHEHIVPVFDVGVTADGLCYVVSKLIDGESLSGAAVSYRADYLRIAELIAAVADALEHAHRRGLVHRDVKPGNVLIDAAGKPYLADFGLALREADFGRPERLAGTPAYMSPEQVRGEGHRVDSRTDIFSLGIILYELMTGGHPYGGGDARAIMQRISFEVPRSPRAVSGSIPRELERICLRALAPRASDRYETAREMAEELRLFAAGAHADMTAAGDVPAPVPGEATLAVEAPSSRVVRVVPRGLRSFGAEDADFFLSLMQGARDRDGLPGSIRFWKSWIEGTESAPVGLIYGLSGCGKSSMVKAGLLPRLIPRVVTIYEVAGSDLETRLLTRIRRACPDLPADATLVEAMTEIRRGALLPVGSKLLLVLDQFEQWLHANRPGPDVELVRALRQCDGGRIQAIVMVRVDFWMDSSRFMRQLEVRVVEGENAMAVELFPPSHARKVLTALGAAYGMLPDSPGELSADQRAFIDRAVALITREESVMPVRLALFAELVKGRPWSAATLGGLGGSIGIGVRFLDETFVAETAPPEHRLHREAASRVLEALLPGAGVEIQGHVRSYDELLDAAGYREQPARFESLMRILDAETRLITPTGVAGSDEKPADEADETGRSVPGEQRFYHLTHDYLVPSIRDWLARSERETWRGCAELTLAERTSLWSARPEPKQLPSLWEWGLIRTVGDSSRWADSQREMMRAATRYHLVHLGWVAAIVVASIVLFASNEERSRRAQAHGLVRSLLDAESGQVPRIVTELEPYRRFAVGELREAVADPSTPPDPRRHARIALLPVDPSQAGALLESMLDADPEEFRIARDALRPHRPEPIARLWEVALNRERSDDRSFRAAVALASFATDDPRWGELAAPVARGLVEQPSLLVSAWVDMLRPVRRSLVPALATMLREDAVDRPLVASVLSDYAADQPYYLAGQLGAAAPGEFAVLLAGSWTRRADAREAVEAAHARNAAAYAEKPGDATAGEVANTAIALLRLGRAEVVWPMLSAGPDPRIRSLLIDRIPRIGYDPEVLIERLRVETDPSRRAAELLALGRFGTDRLSEERRVQVAPMVAAIYRDGLDPGLHAAAGWVLRKWRRGEDARTALAGLATGRPEKMRGWYVNQHGQTMVVLPGLDEFHMGSPDDEPWRRNNEERRVAAIAPLDVADTEVTIGQFRAFLDDHPEMKGRYEAFLHEEPNLPQTVMTWYEAVAYCNWLSEKEGLPRDQWCYEPNAAAKYAEGMRIVADHASRRGYRLPTEAEWEYACRARTVTSRSFGDSLEILPEYSACAVNTSDRPLPVGSLLPNPFGLFDMHGNVFEWCQSTDPVKDEADLAAGDDLDDHEYRTVRGGGFLSQPRHVRSAARYRDAPILRNDQGGFRVVRSHQGKDTL